MPTACKPIVTEGEAIDFKIALIYGLGQRDLRAQAAVLDGVLLSLKPELTIEFPLDYDWHKIYLTEKAALIEEIASRIMGTKVVLKIVDR